MHTVAAVVLWAALGLIAYAYLFYPLLLWLAYAGVQIGRDWRYLGSRRDRRSPAVPDLPGLSLVIAAYNEARHLPAKLANLRELDYPAGQLQVIFVSDGSEDDTNQILGKAEGIELVALPQRSGKAQALNAGVQRARHDLLVFTDAATLLAPDALRRLARHFTDCRVGAVCGALEFQSTAESHHTEGRFWRYESLLRLMEARLGITLTASGALYALRRQCWQPLGARTLLDDFLIPMRARAAGFAIRYDPEAQAVDFAAASVEGEFLRRVRLAAGSFRAMAALWRMPMPGPTRWAFISHKLFRWIAPFCLPLLLAANVVLALAPGAATGYRALLAAQVSFYALALVGMWRRPPYPAPRLARLAYYVLAMNAAFLVGLVQVLAGRDHRVWRRPEEATQGTL
ncbi:MAG: glycosyltransferase family 2 protein [Terriglobales bacterium]